MLRVGIVGIGGMGRVHSDAYSKMPDIEKAGVYDADPVRAHALAEAYGWSTVYASFEEMITAVDIVDICTPTPTHREYAWKALYAGRDVLSEKPMARTQEDCAALVSAARATGRIFMPAHVLRFFPEYRSAHDLIQRGQIGNPATIRTRRGGAYPQTINDWDADFIQSGGVTLEMLVHDFDWLRWTFGPVETVYAKVAHINHPQPITPLDYSLVTLRFASGAVAQVEGTWAEPGGFSTVLEVTGDGGMITFDSMQSAPLQIYRRSGVSASSPASADPYYLQLRHFVDCVKGRVPPSISPEDGYHAVEIALAALESARTGKPVSLSGSIK